MLGSQSKKCGIDQLEYINLVMFHRERLEGTLASWTDAEQQISVQEAQGAWQMYENMTSPLAQDLCEQLRLVLEPSQASKLK